MTSPVRGNLDHCLAALDALDAVTVTIDMRHGELAASAVGRVTLPPDTDDTDKAGNDD